MPLDGEEDVAPTNARRTSQMRQISIGSMSQKDPPSRGLSPP